MVTVLGHIPRTRLGSLQTSLGRALSVFSASFPSNPSLTPQQDKTSSFKKRRPQSQTVSLLQGFNAPAFAWQPHSHLTPLHDGAEHLPPPRDIVPISFHMCACRAFGKANTILLNFVHELDHKKEGLWTCCSSFMKGGVPVFPRFALTGGFRIGNSYFFINAVLILCSHGRKSIITTQFFITN